jgi:hypothetical protein
MTIAAKPAGCGITAAGGSGAGDRRPERAGYFGRLA